MLVGMHGGEKGSGRKGEKLGGGVAYTEDVKVVGVRSAAAVTTAMATIIMLLVIMDMYSG